MRENKNPVEEEQLDSLPSYPAQAALISVMLEIRQPDSVFLESPYISVFGGKLTCILFNIKFSDFSPHLCLSNYNLSYKYDLVLD